MSTPNFKRGAPAETGPRRNPAQPEWKAKFGGSCEYCQAQIEAGVTSVKWNADRTAVVCASHR